MPYDPVGEVSPVGLIGTAPFVLAVDPSMPGVYAAGAVRAGFSGDLIHAAGEGAAAASAIARELPLTYL